MDQESLFENDEPRATATQMYELPDGDLISGESLKRADEDVQIDVMRIWFFQNFEDPANSTPYDGREGGFQFIWGGPYEADNELQSEFAHILPYEVIEKLVDELNSISTEWAPHSNRIESNIDEYLFEVSAATSHHHEAFESSILNIKRLMEVKGIEAADYQPFLRMLYTGVITALETYLSDRFISSLDSDPRIQRKFVETTPEFRSKTVPLSDVFHAHEKIGETVKAYFANFAWHRLEKVKPMYRDTLAVEFPRELGELFRAIKIRHDLVHRSGKTQDGKEHLLNEAEITKLIEHVEEFISSVEGHTSVDDDSPL
jgi:hypothetical protein